jgi:CDP-6-deoxy-D-xylo-4-hexulose-3-dehydrase
MVVQRREIPIARGYTMGEDEIQRVTAVLRGDNTLGPGPNVDEFESRVAALLGKRRGIMVNSGSSALMIAMRLLDLPQGSEVITSVLTFSTDVTSMAFAGLVPVFVDVEPDTYQIDCEAIERMIGPKTKAMLVPNLIGGMPDWDRLREIADKHKLILIEDSCDTLGGTFRGRPAGERADISVTSFSMHHIITALGTGGMVCVDDDALWDRGLVLRGWGRTSEPYLFGSQKNDHDGRFLDPIDSPYLFDQMFIFREAGYGMVPSEAGAAFGLAQLERLPEMMKRRQEVFARHMDFANKYPEAFIPPRVLDGVITNWQLFPMILKPQLKRRTKDLLLFLDDHNIFTRVIWSGNMTRQPMMEKIEHRTDAACYPNADRVMQFSGMIPANPELSDEDIQYIHDVLEDFLAGLD